MASPSIPIIDISPYLDGTNKEYVANQIGNACESIGFFMISNHGVPLSLLEQLQSHATAYFNQPLSTKLETQAPFGLGYMADGIENVAATLQEEENGSTTIKDSKESLNLTLSTFGQKNVWPENSPQLNKVCHEYYEHVERLAKDLMRLFALALNLEETYFDDKVDNPYTTLRLLNYPEMTPSTVNQPLNLNTIRNAEHTDYGTLTILWSSDSRGLQAKSRQNEWIDVVAPANHFIINIGDLMMNWTNDDWISTLHRVVPHPETRGRRRMSVPFFHNPNPTTVIECLPGRIKHEGKAKYKPILAKDHLERKVSLALGKEVKMLDTN